MPSRTLRGLSLHALRGVGRTPSGLSRHCGKLAPSMPGLSATSGIADELDLEVRTTRDTTRRRPDCNSIPPPRATPRPADGVDESAPPGPNAFKYRARKGELLEEPAGNREVTPAGVGSIGEEPAAPGAGGDQAGTPAAERSSRSRRFTPSADRRGFSCMSADATAAAGGALGRPHRRVAGLRRARPLSVSVVASSSTAPLHCLRRVRASSCSAAARDTIDDPTPRTSSAMAKLTSSSIKTDATTNPALRRGPR